MFRLLGLRLCSVTLASGVVLEGDLNPVNRERLLKGTATLPDGRVYSGVFDAQKGFPLPGSQLEEDGDIYRGAFNEKWQREGLGEAWLADGTYYKGHFTNDELVEGVVRIPNGSSEMTFEGTLVDELLVRGKLSQPDFTYEGEFQENQPHGKGKLIFATGAEQEGTFYAGKLHGDGCKMKLDGGFVYVGEFIDGKIRRGVLYTPTYTYEGDFNENGRAHGEGRQTYLIHEPRLIFSGIWNNGALIRGACVDEYGSPVDWQNRHELQSMILGDSTQSSGDECVAMNSYCGAKLLEADRLHRDMNKSYAEDAATVVKATGRFPSKMDLGYEGGMERERVAATRSSQRQMQQMDEFRERLSSRAQSFEEVSEGLRNGNIIAEINENMAKIQFSRQMGAQQLAAERVDEQFERFMTTFNRPSKTLTESEASKEENLKIEGNAPWKSFTPKGLV